MFSGTPITMAPEVWQENYTSKCDVWSVGCMLFQILTGKNPFLAKGHKKEDWLPLLKKGPNWDLFKADSQMHFTG